MDGGSNFNTVRVDVVFVSNIITSGYSTGDGDEGGTGVGEETCTRGL